ncbi:hypothetical protein [Streptomyces sp. NPDC048295]
MINKVSHNLGANLLPVNNAIDLALKANKQLGSMAASIYRNP